MENVNKHLLTALQQAWATALCGPAGCASHVLSATTVRESRVKPLPVFLLTTLVNTLRTAFGSRPEWIIAGSGLTAPIAWLAARCTGNKVAVYLHGLDIVAPSRIYRWLWLPFIRRCDITLVNSHNTAVLAESRAVPSNNMHVLHPGTDLPLLDDAAALAFRKRHEWGQRKLLLSVGRLTQRKGLLEFVENALPAIAQNFPDVLLVIIGDEASDALHGRAGSERERILAAAKATGVEHCLCFLGRCDDATLSAAYQAADLHVFPVLELSGDVEGFGMVALESAAHGLPTVAFSVGGVPDAVLESRTGFLIASGNYVEFSIAVIRLLGQERSEESRAFCHAFAAEKAWPVFGDRLRMLLGSANE